MLKLMSRVYHKGLRANGYISEIDEEKTRDKYKVNFFWAKYVPEIKHGTWTDRPEQCTKWQWCEEGNLIETNTDSWYDAVNMVTSIGGRSLDRLIRRVCEINRRNYGDGSDVIICYGQSNHRVPESKLLLNRNIIINKKHQCRIMGKELAPEISDASCADDNNWIAKPYVSMGGRGIRTVEAGERIDTSTRYLQKRFPKIREFRAHCFLWNENPVPFIQEKKISDTSQLCWNKKQGGRFWYVYQEGLDLAHQDLLSLELRNQITEMSVAALKKLKYDFGGLDFGMDADGNLTIFEVNSRMGLLEQSLFTYKRVFNELRTLDINTYKEERWT